VKTREGLSVDAAHFLNRKGRLKQAQGNALRTKKNIVTKALQGRNNFLV
jgi:hypothetical protein